MCVFRRKGSVTYGLVGGAPRALDGSDVAGFLAKFPGAENVEVEKWDTWIEIDCGGQCDD